MKQRNFYKAFVRPFLFQLPAEVAHNISISGLSALAHLPNQSFFFRDLLKIRDIPVKCFGVDFPNPVGLAAGMDKAASALPVWESLGFGFSEIGGVTQHEQPGNQGPRMFRVRSHQAVINRMGFNNPGADIFAEHLEEWVDRSLWPAHPVGINLGKSKITDLAKAHTDYLYSFRKLRQYADFFVINVSSPNTAGLRSLQEKDSLAKIVETIQNENSGNSRKPILVKVSPDLEDNELADIVQVAFQFDLSGIVATNTTSLRPTLHQKPPTATYQESGGLSGAPLENRSNQVIKFLFSESQGRIPIIGVGGVRDTKSAIEKFRCGASLIQIYTGLVYEGPMLVPKILKGLEEFMRENNLKSLTDLHPQI